MTTTTDTFRSAYGDVTYTLDETSLLISPDYHTAAMALGVGYSTSEAAELARQKARREEIEEAILFMHSNPNIMVEWQDHNS